jgi:hypothetical protein
VANDRLKAAGWRPTITNEQPTWRHRAKGGR